MIGGFGLRRRERFAVGARSPPGVDTSGPRRPGRRPGRFRSAMRVAGVDVLICRCGSTAPAPCWTSPHDHRIRHLRRSLTCDAALPAFDQVFGAFGYERG